MVVCFALLAAFANAVASICQRLGVEDAPDQNGPSLGLVRHMVQRKIWLVGFAIMALGYASQAVALHLGSLDVVQPIMVSELVILVLILWLWYFTPLRPRDLVSAAATAVGLGVFLFISSPSVGSRVPSDARWLEAGAATAVVVGVFVVLGSREAPWRRALLLGAGASTGFALLAAITKSLTDVLATGWGGLFTSWQLYAIAVVGLGSFVVMQSAFQVGPFAASQSTLILVNPFVSIAVGHVLFGESLRGGPLDVTLELVALAVMVIGALGVSASPLVAAVHDETGAHHLLKGRGRYAQWLAQRPST
jgi:drug/metabolite transporter (DMT)-like permease